MTILSAIITPTNIVTAENAVTFTNKTINGSSNTLSNISLAAAVTGTLPVANGGTGATSLTSGYYLKGNGTSAVGAQSGVPTTDITGTLGVANGGTGATTLTANNVVLGNGTSAVQFVAPGTAGNVLTSDGTTWTSAAGGGGGAGAFVAFGTTGGF